MSEFEKRRRELRRRYEKGETVEALAEEMGVHPQTVRHHLTKAGTRMRPPGPVPKLAKR